MRCCWWSVRYRSSSVSLSFCRCSVTPPGIYIGRWWSQTRILHKNNPARRKDTAMRQTSRPLSSRGVVRASDARLVSRSRSRPARALFPGGPWLELRSGFNNSERREIPVLRSQRPVNRHKPNAQPLNVRATVRKETGATLQFGHLRKQVAVAQPTINNDHRRALVA